MTKADLKTGMFGVMSNGKRFVIVNDLIVYQDGGFDCVKELDKDLRFLCYRIDKLFDVKSFDQARAGIHLLYDRLAETIMTITEIEEKLGVKNLRIKGE